MLEQSHVWQCEAAVPRDKRLEQPLLVTVTEKVTVDLKHIEASIVKNSKRIETIIEKKFNTLNTDISTLATTRAQRGPTAEDFKLVQQRIEELEKEVATLKSSAIAHQDGSPDMISKSLRTRLVSDGSETDHDHQSSSSNGNADENADSAGLPTWSGLSTRPAGSSVEASSRVENDSRKVYTRKTNENDFIVKDKTDTNVPSAASSKGSSPGFQPPNVCVLGFKSATAVNNYSGLINENLNTFVRQFNDQMTAANEKATALMRRNAFLTFLSGGARDLADHTIAGNPNASVDDIIKDLRASFDSELYNKLRITQVERCKQESGETLEKFYTRVTTLAAQAHSHESPETINKKVRDAFLNGLQDNIRYVVKDKNPKTAHDAYTEAIRQDILREDRIACHNASPSTLAVLERVNAIMSAYHDKGGPSQPRDISMITCFYCQEKGHYADSCPVQAAGGPRVQRPGFAPRNPYPTPAVNTAVPGLPTQNELMNKLAEAQKQINELTRHNTELLLGTGPNNVFSLAWPPNPRQNKSINSQSNVNTMNAAPKPLTAQIPIKVNGYPCFGLVDTGATITVANDSFRSIIGNPDLKPAVSAHAIGLGGNAISMAGAASLQFSIGSFSLAHSVHFTANDCTPKGPREYAVILGNDFLAKIPRFSINYQREVIHVGNEIIPIGQQHCARQNMVYEIVVSNKTKIPPQSEAMIACVRKGPPSSTNPTLLIESQCLASSGLITTPALVDSATFRLFVTNPSDEEIILKAGQKAAEATEIDPEELASN